MHIETIDCPVTDWQSVLKSEISLDPENWQQARDWGHHLINEMVDYLQDIPNQPIWKIPSDQLKQSIKTEWQATEGEIQKIYNSFKKNILPFPAGNIHPRFWSWVQGTGSITAAYADFMASIMNSNVTIGDHSAMYIEQQVIDWWKDVMGFDKETSSGILLSGGSMANITGLIIARNAVSPDIRSKGLQQRNKPLVIYASSETHSCQQKAAEIMGIGNENLRRIPVDDKYQIRLDILEKSILEDIHNGYQPFCIVGNIGTVNTGAIDPIDELVLLAKQYELWLHIDGAFGALVKLLPEYDHLIHSLHEADSIAFDLHKWMYLPYEAGCLLVKDKHKHRAAFAMQPNYLIMHERGLSAGPDPIGNYGMELSRGFKALKVWFCLQEHGKNKYEQIIRQNIAQIQYLASLVIANEKLELMAPTPTNIACFRYKDARLNTEKLNALNKEILMQLHEKAVAAPSYTVLHGNYMIRVANVNHRSKKSDFEALVHGVVEIGNEFVSKFL